MGGWGGGGGRVEGKSEGRRTDDRKGKEGGGQKCGGLRAGGDENVGRKAKEQIVDKEEVNHKNVTPALGFMATGVCST